MTPRKRGLPFNTDVKKYIHRFPDLKYNGTHITCTTCNANFFLYDACDCRRHVRSKRHLQNITNQIPYWQFLNDFLFILIACNISFNILDNDGFRHFWAKYVPQWKLPGRTQLRSKLPQVQEIVKNLIQDELKQNKLWITVDETSDAKNVNVVNVLVRTLKPSEPSVPFLLCSKRLANNANAITIVQIIKDAITDLGLTKMQIEMLVTDGAAYMLTAGRILKTYFPNILHVTCVLHEIHLVADSIRQSYSTVDSLVTNTKNIFVKSSKHSRKFKELCPGIPQPPEPIINRGGTWLEAVMYYSKYFESVKSFILELNSRESESIKISQQLFLDPHVQKDIGEICKKYFVVKESIARLQNSHLSLAESLNIVDTLTTSLEKFDNDEIGRTVSDKFKNALEKNPDLSKIGSINRRICNKQLCEVDDQEYFRFANITSLDAELSFSKYTTTYSPLRRRLNESALEGILMLQIYASSVHSLPVRLPSLPDTQ